jgi:predicted transcriptional regulator
VWKRFAGGREQPKKAKPAPDSQVQAPVKICFSPRRKEGTVKVKKIDPPHEHVKRKTQARKYRGGPSYAIPIWNGILEHRDKIGPALWEFLWCVDKITIEDEHGVGWLLGKTPIDTKRIARDLNEHPDTAYDNLNRLAEQGYILRKRTPRGYSIGVVNSKKFHVFRSRSDSEKTPNHMSSDSDKTPNHDSEETPNHGVCDSEKTPSVIRRKLLLEETVQEDRAVQRDRAVQFDKIGGGEDSTPDRPLLSPEIQKLVAQLETNLTSEMSGWGLNSSPTYHPIRRWFEEACADLGKFRQSQKLYDQTFARVEKALAPAVVPAPIPFTKAMIDIWAAEAATDPDIKEIVWENDGSLVLVCDSGSSQYVVGESELFWHAYDSPELIEQMLKENLTETLNDTEQLEQVNARIPL